MKIAAKRGMSGQPRCIKERFTNEKDSQSAFRVERIHPQLVKIFG